jgi:fermentation-respiration switch protein FrsA (DUF1100 family)
VLFEGPLAFFVGGQFDALARVRDLAVPILVAHGDRDDIAPFELGQRLFAAANEPKRFLRVPGGNHNDVFAGLGLIEAIAEFARAVIAGAASLLTESLAGSSCVHSRDTARTAPSRTAWRATVRVYWSEVRSGTLCYAPVL